MRKFLPLVFILLLSSCADIDRNLYALSDAVAPVDRVTGQRSLSFDSRQGQIEQSNREVDKAINKYIASGKPINEKVSVSQYKRIQTVFKRVHAVSHLRNEKWKAYLIPDSEWNASAMGGTYIFINKGLMDEIKSDDELAAVIGHEIAHISANHVYEQSSYTMAARLNGSKGVKKKSFQAAFTLKNEEEADEIGTLYATLAGYDPSAASQVWKRMYDNGGDYSAMTIDHPINSQRYERTEELAEKYKQYYIPNKVNPKYAEILETNNVFGSGEKKHSNLEAGKGGGLFAVLETVADTMQKHNQAKVEQHNQQTQQQLIQYVTQSIAITDRKIGDDNTLLVYFDYTGVYPISNLTMMTIIGKETSNDHSSDFILQPQSSAVSEFQFKSVDLNTVDLEKISVIVAHAEMN